MNPRITFAVATRVLTQVRRDHRTAAMLLVLPCLLITLLWWMFKDLAGGAIFDQVGPALLAIFPFGDSPPGEVAAAALRAARAAIRALGTLTLEPPPRCGMALHLGEVSYGNIGAGSRLDFTAIGPAVNQTARLAPPTSRLHRPLVASAAFPAVIDAELEPLGSFELRGFGEAVPVYGLAA